MEQFQQNVKVVLDRLSAIRIVPVLVLDNLEDGLKMCSVLQEKQLPAAEITFRTEAAESVIRAAAKEFPGLYLGAGTVLNVRDLHPDRGRGTPSPPRGSRSPRLPCGT